MTNNQRLIIKHLKALERAYTPNISRNRRRYRYWINTSLKWLIKVEKTGERLGPIFHSVRTMKILKKGGKT
jgi:hypothetical protein